MSPQAEIVAKEVEAQIDRLRDLTSSPGWDSYDASPVPNGGLDQARDCIWYAAREIPVPTFRAPFVGPTPAPGVSLVWRIAGHGELDAHFTRIGGTFMVLSPERKVVSKGRIDTPKRFVIEVLKPYLQQAK